MRIGELAAKTGVTVRALRYYEEQQLLTSVRGDGGQRRYSDSAVDRVQLIQLLYSAGLSSKTILSLLPCIDSRTNTPQSRAALAAERERIDQQIAELVKARNKLDEVIAMCQHPASSCTYVDSAPA
jgi:DNA-binding transcriptional MerR regulator